MMLMKRSLCVLPLAALLVAGYPALVAADDMAEQCRKMAAEDEVAPEDMEDYIAECLAVVQAESAEDAAEAMDRMDSASTGDGEDPGAAPTPTPAAPAAKP